MIPKKIHWCWLSEEPLSDGAIECLKTWKDVMPDYETVLWDMERIKNIPLPTVIKLALELKKWALVADYIRLYAVYSEGGIYFDSDVIAVKPFPEEMLNHRFFTSVEHFGTYITGLQAAIFGADEGHPFLMDCMNYYANLNSGEMDAVLNYQVIAPHIHIKIASEKYGFQYKDEKQILEKEMVIYPYYMLAGFYDQVNEETIAWHVCHGSWRMKPEPSIQKLNKLLIGVPTCRGICPETIECLWNLDTSMFDKTDLFISRNGYGVARNKNMIAEKAINEGYNFIFTVDDDMTFPPDTIQRLMKLFTQYYSADIASAWAMQIDGTTNICKFIKEKNSYQCMRKEELSQDWFLDEDYQILKTEAIGIACTLIKTDPVYTKQGYPYHVYHEYPNKTLISEDLYFCDQLRVHRPEIKILVDLSLKAGHIKQQII